MKDHTDDTNTDKNPVSGPFIVHESALARQERTIKRLWILVILLIALLAGSNGAWIWYESQFEDVVTTETYESNAEDGGVAIVNRDGEVNYGTDTVHEDK